MKIYIAAIISLLLVQNCYADWPVKKKRAQIIPTYSYYYSGNYFNKSGAITSIGVNSHFVTHYFSLFGMYGLSNRLDLLVNVPFVNQRLRSEGSLTTNTGLGDLSVGLAYHFPSQDLKRILTLKGSFIFPGYQNASTPNLGYGSRGYQLAAAFAYVLSEKVFVGAEATYTQYIDASTGPTQYLFSGNLGYKMNPFDKITFNFSHQLSMSTDNSFSTNLATVKDFVIGKIACSYGHRISRTVTPYFQVYFTPYGYNTGVATGFSVYAIIKIP